MDNEPDKTLPDPAAVLAPESRQALAGIVDGLMVLRGVLVMGLIVIAVLAIPEQTKEVYRAIGQNLSTQLQPDLPWLPPWMLAFVAVLALSIVLWQLARELTYAARVSRRRELDLDHPAAIWTLHWGPRVIATLPFLGAAIGLWPRWAGRDTPDPAGGDIIARFTRLTADLERGALVCLMAALAMLVVTTLIEIGLDRTNRHAGRRFSLFSNWFLFPVILLVTLVWFAQSPIELPQKFGAVPIFAFWAANAAAVVALCTWLYDAYRVPALAILAAALIVFEATGLSDNHRIRTLDTNVARTSVRTAFLDWLTTRGDLEVYRSAGRPYPIYVFTAEGGGLYAALHSAKFLARIQDLCPSFAQHVFALSAVSGGSLGSAVFNGLLHDTKVRNGPLLPCKMQFSTKGSLETKAEKILDADFLSPVTWAALFPDFLQRFLPYPFQSLDRAVALEKSFEQAWRRGSGSQANLFDGSFFALCSPGAAICDKAQTAVPALVLNMTNVDTGAQMVLSPMWFDTVGPPNTPTGTIYDMQMKSSQLQDLRLSTAVGLSARAPWVTPVGWHEVEDLPQKGSTRLPGKRRMGFVDGGYFESSGAATGDNLARFIDHVFQEHKIVFADERLKGLDIEIKLVMISASFRPVEDFFTSPPHRQAYGEITLPLATLLKAWSARSSSTQYEVRLETSGVIRATTAEFDNSLIPLPTGWQLAGLSREYLDQFTGTPQECKNEAAGLPNYRGSSGCIIDTIMRDLAPVTQPTYKARIRGLVPLTTPTTPKAP